MSDASDGTMETAERAAFIRESMRRIFRSLLQAFPDLHFGERLLVADGDYVIGDLVMTGTAVCRPCQALESTADPGDPRRH